jgi:hypothetical protein
MVEVFGGAHHRPGLAGHEHLEHHPEAEGEGKQVSCRDRPRRGHRLIERAVHALKDAPAGELGQQALDGLLEPDQALRDDSQRRHGCNGLAGGGDAEDGVPFDGRPSDVEAAERPDMHLLAPGHQGDEPWHLLLVHMPLGGGVDTLDSRLGQTLGHGLSIPTRREGREAQRRRGDRSPATVARFGLQVP